MGWDWKSDLAKLDPTTNQDVRNAVLTGGVSLVTPQFVKDEVTHVGKVVATDPKARAVVQIAGTLAGVPPWATAAALAVNDVGQGVRDPMEVIRNYAKDYATAYAAGKGKEFLMSKGVPEAAAASAASQGVSLIKTAAGGTPNANANPNVNNPAANAGPNGPNLMALMAMMQPQQQSAVQQAPAKVESKDDPALRALLAKQSPDDQKTVAELLGLA